MNYQPVADDQIVELIRAYIDLRSLPDQQNEALDRLTDSIFRMEVRYISKLVMCKWETAVDIHLLANDVTYEFLDRYLIGQSRNFSALDQVSALLKKIARSRVVNAIRDNRRGCRHPDQAMGDGVRFVRLDWITNVEDTRSDGQPSDPLEYDEMIGVLESKLGDPNLRSVFRLVIHGYSTSEIAAKLNWDKRTAERLLAEVREELRPWCESNLSLGKEPRTTNQEPRTKNQEPRDERRETRDERRETRNEKRESRIENRESRIEGRESRGEGRGARNYRRENREIDSVIKAGNAFRTWIIYPMTAPGNSLR